MSTCNQMDLETLGSQPIRVCSPKVVYDLKWFVTYKYILKFEMHISKEQDKEYHLRKSTSTVSRIHKIFHFHAKNRKSPMMFLIWIC